MTMAGPSAPIHHNVRLPDGTETLPGKTPLAEWEASRSLLRLAALTDRKPKRKTRVVDLGCLDGGYAIEFARAGYEAVGIDARQSNIDRCQAVADQLALKNLSFVCDDARNIEAHGPFDIVCCLGLLYHLEYPVKFLRSVAALEPRLLIIHGHVAEKDDAASSVGSYRLGGLTENEGVQGRWYGEPVWNSVEEMEDSSLSSWENSRSFWLTRPALLQTLRECGFSIVFEQFDHLEEIDESPTVAEMYSTGSFVGIRT